MNDNEQRSITEVGELQFNLHGLIPAIVQDASTREVLMLAYMNEESLKKTIESGFTWFYSRSRQKLWQKGESSGNVQSVRQIKYDCDLDTLLVIVDQTGSACHTEQANCFYRTLTGADIPSDAHIESFASVEKFDLDVLFDVIKARKRTMPEGSYTSALFKEGRSSITAKIDEEAAEVIDAAFNKSRPDVIWEAADLIYHLFVLLVNENIEIDDVVAELAGRHKPAE